MSKASDKTILGDRSLAEVPKLLVRQEIQSAKLNKLWNQYLVACGVEARLAVLNVFLMMVARARS